MKDRTSYSYRADLSGGTPDMHKNGGMARDEFKRVRCSPYIREHSQGHDDAQDKGDDRAKSLKGRRKIKRAKTVHLRPNF